MENPKSEIAKSDSNDDEKSQDINDRTQGSETAINQQQQVDTNESHDKAKRSEVKMDAEAKTEEVAETASEQPVEHDSMQDVQKTENQEPEENKLQTDEKTAECTMSTEESRLSPTTGDLEGQDVVQVSDKTCVTPLDEKAQTTMEITNHATGTGQFKSSLLS